MFRQFCLNEDNNWEIFCWKIIDNHCDNGLSFSIILCPRLPRGCTTTPQRTPHTTQDTKPHITQDTKPHTTKDTTTPHKTGHTTKDTTPHTGHQTTHHTGHHTTKDTGHNLFASKDRWKCSSALLTYGTYIYVGYPSQKFAQSLFLKTLQLYFPSSCFWQFGQYFC